MERSSKIEYRRLQLADVQRMHEIEMLCFSVPWSLASLYREMDNNPFAVYLGAYDGRLLVGYVGIWRIMDEAHMTNIAVVPDYQRRGIARNLLIRIINMARSEGAQSMTLEVRESNSIARKLYASMGFLDIGRRKGYYTDNKEDAIIMWCHDLRCHDDAV
jgi:ribosomal-protein-alanine N-acetyltransferase